jgi:hypothetical protein
MFNAIAGRWKLEPTKVELSENGAELLRQLIDKTGQTSAEIVDAALAVYLQKILFDEAGADAHLRSDPEAWAEFQADQKEWDDPPADNAPPTQAS